MASFSFCRQEEKKRKSQSGERQMKDERILNLQRKIVEKAMERKKQAGLLKITPQKANTASRKVWKYIRKRALQQTCSEFCCTASTGKGGRSHTGGTVASPCFLHRHSLLKPWPWPHLPALHLAATDWVPSTQYLPFHSCHHTLKQHLTSVPNSVSPSHYIKLGRFPHPRQVSAHHSFDFNLTFPPPDPTTSNESTDRLVLSPA